LYAGGWFTQAGATAAGGIARFDGAGWHDLAGGLAYTNPPSLPAFTTSMVSYRGQLLVSGLFKFAGGVPGNYFARWTGDQWLAIPGFTNFPYVVQILDGNFYAAGMSSMLREYGCPPCVADIDGDGLVEFPDVLAFSTLFDEQDPAADLNGDGLVD